MPHQYYPSPAEAATAGIRQLTGATSAGVAEGRLRVSATRGQGWLWTTDTAASHPAPADGGTDTYQQTPPLPEMPQRHRYRQVSRRAYRFKHYIED